MLGSTYIIYFLVYFINSAKPLLKMSLRLGATYLFIYFFFILSCSPGTCGLDYLHHCAGPAPTNFRQPHVTHKAIGKKQCIRILLVAVHYLGIIKLTKDKENYN